MRHEIIVLREDLANIIFCRVCQPVQIYLLQVIVGASLNFTQMLEDASLLEWDQLDITDPLQRLAEVVISQEVSTNERLCCVCKRFAGA